MKISGNDRTLGWLVNILMILVMVVTLYPFLNALAISFNDANDTQLGGITILPRVPTLLNYQVVLENKAIFNAYLITILRTAIGTALSIGFTSMLAYGLSKTELRGRKIYMGICVFTMYFYGGLIPFYIVMRSMGLVNSFFILVLPGIVSVWNMIVFKSFFENVPQSLEESAKIDGAGAFTIFVRIVAPVSKPVFASLSLFVAVANWNSWFDASIFITNEKLLPMQTILMRIINSNVMNEQLAMLNANAAEMMRIANKVSTKSLLMATMMVATIPILVVYPFVQKYFANGVMIGSVKE
jgi:putative aldouronate transport system permease protein